MKQKNNKQMSRKMGSYMKDKNRQLIRSSAAEYLTFVAAAGDSEASVEMRYENENIWLTQKMMATVYDVSVSAINQHLKCHRSVKIHHSWSLEKCTTF